MLKSSPDQFSSHQTSHLPQFSSDRPTDPRQWETWSQFVVLQVCWPQSEFLWGSQISGPLSVLSSHEENNQNKNRKTSCPHEYWWGGQSLLWCPGNTDKMNIWTDPGWLRPSLWGLWTSSRLNEFNPACSLMEEGLDMKMIIQHVLISPLNSRRQEVVSKCKTLLFWRNSEKRSWGLWLD